MNITDFRVSDHGVTEVFVFTDGVEIARRLIDRARDARGEDWWDDYDERTRVVNYLIAGTF